MEEGQSDNSQWRQIVRQNANVHDEIPVTVSDDSGAAEVERTACPVPTRTTGDDEVRTIRRESSRLDENNINVDAADDPNVEDIILSPLESVMTQNANSTVRWTMTGAGLLFLLAGFLTILVASRYRFILACVWATLLFMFGAFVWFVQQTVLCSSNNNNNKKRVFHPAVHAVADWVQQQVQDLRDDVRDCYSEYLLLSNEPEFDSYRAASDFESDPTAHASTEKKPKSALFRVFVKPALSVLFRGRRKRRQKREQAAADSGSAYVPPRSNHPNLKETELV